MNLATDCVANVAALDNLMAPLLAQKKAELAKLHSVLNARLELWCEQVNDSQDSKFDGGRGFGFDGRFKDSIFSDELLTKLVVEGDVVHATFDPGVFIESVFTMSLPLRYLDAETGEAAIIQDAAAYKAQHQAQYQSDQSGPGM